MVDNAARQEEQRERAAFHVLCLAMFKNPRFVRRTVRHIMNQTTLPGFRRHPRPRSLVRTPKDRGLSVRPESRSAVFGTLSADHLTVETIDDLMRMVSTNIIHQTLRSNASAIQIDVDLTMLSLIQRVRGRQDPPTELGESPLILPEIAIFVIEVLCPRLDVRFMFRRSPSTIDSYGNAWLRWWGHAFLSAPQTLLQGDALFRIALDGIRSHAKSIFAQGATRPHNGVSTPVYYEQCKYNVGIAARLYDGWYWILTYLVELAHLVCCRHQSYEKFIAFRRWFLETLSVICFVATQDIGFMRYDSIGMAEFGSRGTHPLNFTAISSASDLHKLMADTDWIHLRASAPLSANSVSHDDVGLKRMWETGHASAFWKKCIADPLAANYAAYTKNKVIGRFFE